MNQPTNVENVQYFVDGGTLPLYTPSYVPRPADRDLLQSVLDSRFCYVLTTRQMGKSSLMIRTAKQVRDRGGKAALVDLTAIGAKVSRDQWYLGILTRLKSELQLTTDAEAWWGERQHLGEPQRLSDFLRDVVLSEIRDGQVVIFIDEIDSTLSLDFGADDFFSVIRAIYNERSNTQILNRLTFVLLGVATPSELIRERNSPLFNIGRRIDLQEFSLDDAEPLRLGLERSLGDNAAATLQQIFEWTGGHPYLTQKLCMEIVATERKEIASDEVDSQVRTFFFSEDGEKDTNLRFVRDRIKGAPINERRPMLELYRRVYAGEDVPIEDRSTTQNALELAGLIRKAGRQLHVRNQIYRQVFNIAWIDEMFAEMRSEERHVSRQRTLSILVRIAIGALIAVAVILVLVLVLLPMLIR
jgi:hypothetical protein